MVQNPDPKNNYSFYGRSAYYIGLKGFKVDGVALNIPSDAFEFGANATGGVIIDSGTPVTYIVDAAYNPLLDTMQSLIKYPIIPAFNFTNRLGPNLHIEFDLCYNVSGVQRPKFPNVTMVFDGMDLDLPQDNVFLRLPGYKDTMGITFGSAGPGPTQSIFGNIQQQNFQMRYDREASRYGFAKVQCDTLSSG